MSLFEILCVIRFVLLREEQFYLAAFTVIFIHLFFACKAG